MTTPKILLIAYDNDAHMPFFPMGLAALAAYCRKHGYHVDIYNQDIHHYPESHLTEFKGTYGSGQQTGGGDPRGETEAVLRRRRTRTIARTGVFLAATRGKRCCHG